MAGTRSLYCTTCGTDEQHRVLFKAEQVWLKGRILRKNVDEFVMCQAPGCRKLRTGHTKEPLADVLRIPEDL
ncbi:hypothetical protein [Streptomyces mesophilus]|uniref:hypothetical protein n=1 Tax=Streptomyces mesophilus TaxID=1775132 RepID=UPI00331F10FD